MYVCALLSVLELLFLYTHCININLNASKPSEHPPDRGKNIVVRLRSGNPIKCLEEVLPRQPMLPPKRFDGMLRKFRCVQISLKAALYTIASRSSVFAVCTPKHCQDITADHAN
ncbi:unnamed protein product [Ascophyllum nodosum]